MRPGIVILGAGPAGLAAAWKLAERGSAVTVLEAGDAVGGMAGSFTLAGLPVDYGSHRLHPSCSQEILADIRRLLGDDLLLRPRHGRILLDGRWVHFPLRLADLMTRLPWSFRLGTAADLLRKVVPRPSGAQASFAEVMRRGLGATICRKFYFPYVRKIWGLPPEDLSEMQARRRVSANSLGKMLRKVLGLARATTPNRGMFYYPRGGFGRIAEAMAKAAAQAGANIRLKCAPRRVRIGGSPEIAFESAAGPGDLSAKLVLSTIPSPLLVGMLDPPAPLQTLEACQSLRFRGMVLVYLVLDCPRFSQYDAHYFPGADVPLTRLSEPKNYGDPAEPADRTVLCGEIPCQVGDATWRMDETGLGRLLRQALDQCGLPIAAEVVQVAIRRLPEAYPIYRRGYEADFERIDAFLSGLKGLVTFGRQGLFAHDNVHHAVAMGYAAAECVDDFGRFDCQRWQDFRAGFAGHVVED